MSERSPRIPPGQTETRKWPVLHYGEIPRYAPGRWDFRCFGLVDEERRWSLAELKALPQVETTSDIHCVTTWSRLDARFRGVRVRDLIAPLRVKPEAQFVLVHADPGYTTNLPLADLMGDDVLLATHADGEPLSPEHGGPVRLVVPKLYFWKSAKWVRGFELVDIDVPGFWERAGYHMRGDPWREERYRDSETNAMQRMRAEAKRRGR
ncbi:MAG TPA: sulfite oxidase-like oxidoreductase [Myxococcota bacterium]|nr:sulfite oxidase-like oxidoreductase [Myxococcota bacterium]